MNNFQNIQNKLEGFIRRYYTNELLKGFIMFFVIGLLYFLLTLFIEHILWLNTTARSILFWLFVLVEFALLVKFIFIPLAKLFKLQKGIDYAMASKIIGTYFPDVNDKLLNVLQLNQSTSKSELLLASIEQKSLELNPVPFKLAVNFKRNLRYLKYAAIPIAILLLTFFTGNFNWFSDSYQRVVHYKTAYEPPAPFQFFVLNDNLNAIENKDFKLVVNTAGDVFPENVEINYNNETYFLHQTGVGEFEYVFSQPKYSVEFRLSSNQVRSKPYTLEVVEVPTLLSFLMFLDYPNHTKKQNEILKGTGNAVVPEGTKIKWQLNTKSTQSVSLFSKDSLDFISSKSNVFEASKQVFNNFNYTLSTSNANLKNYENLAFNIQVVKDEFPEINIKMATDSLDLQTLYFYGQVSDDFGFNKLQLVYYPSDNEQDKHYEAIPISNSNIAEFISTFPNNLEILEGMPYTLYFQVFDNDVVNGSKSAKSSFFTYRKRTQTEEEQKVLQEQSETIHSLNKSLNKFDEQDKQLEELSRSQKEKSNLNFNDKKKLESFLKRQKQQDDMMKNFNKQLKNNLKEFNKQSEKEDILKEDLNKRLKDNEEQLKKDEKLLDELEKIQEKINKENLAFKLDELAKQNKNKKRSLQQLLELAKRFYVEKKLEKLKNELKTLSEDQEKLSKASNENNTKNNQDTLNKGFDDFIKEIDGLEKENKELQKPFDIPRDKLNENEIKSEQKDASNALEKKEENDDLDIKNQEMQKAKNSQKNAAHKMKQMSSSMQNSLQRSAAEQMQEDTEMLRQILDNLVLFSFNQEAVMNQFKDIEVDHNKYAKYLREQNNLKEHFEHIDDSLFALSLRQPKLSENVNIQITEVFYNMDKALKLFADNQVYQGVSNQQFTVTAANNLSDFLSNVLDNMQENLSMSPSSGQGDMQLPDIIMSQDQLNKMMEEGMKKGDSGKPEQNGNGENDNNKSSDKQKTKLGQGEGEGEKQPLANGFSNDSNGELYEIYQKQQLLRQSLEDKLTKDGMGSNGQNLVRKMEEIELDLLNTGFTNNTLQKMLELQHQLLKLDHASFQQGEDYQRKSETNTNIFENNSNSSIPTAKQYFQTTEILNRQSLPLRQVYKIKVHNYFKSTND
ncbi:hypothetical protein APS56_10910 [Pseudalgibacter alginicilyticus]|uniref:Glutamyl-tRNA synthetase n=1 Tax=Pseudalgibacter alginicilyticus TaxID=1736674 RepID=A0A0P0DBX3_9FLAO|nr:DUF4175 family protein [Pseudalgibacter alginicilyticus]ALJ05603.1 hypothetical protein APS56_10910 [Pseudalgibacter alginicilyticus]